MVQAKAWGHSCPFLFLTSTLSDSPKALPLEQIQNLTTSCHSLVPSRETFLDDMTASILTSLQPVETQQADSGPHSQSTPRAPVSHRPAQSTPYYCAALISSSLPFACCTPTSQSCWPTLTDSTGGWTSAPAEFCLPVNSSQRPSQHPSAFPFYDRCFLAHTATWHAELVTWCAPCPSRNVSFTAAGTYQCSSLLPCP